MANKFIDWIDRVGVPIMGFVAVTSTLLMAIILIFRIFLS